MEGLQVIPDIDKEIKMSVWLAEVWLPDVRAWRVDKMWRLEKYAAAYIAAMKSDLVKGQRLRMRRFIQEQTTPRGGKVRKVRD